MSSTDRNLLFGILALHNRFIARDELLVAMQAWVLEKETPLGDILVRQAAITQDERGLIDALVSRHLTAHNEDPEQSLTALEGLDSIRDQLRLLTDPKPPAGPDNVPQACECWQMKCPPLPLRCRRKMRNREPALLASILLGQGLADTAKLHGVTSNTVETTCEAAFNLLGGRFECN